MLVGMSKQKSKTEARGPQRIGNRPRVRLVDIAEQAGVSRTAVARVLLGTGADRVRVSSTVETRIRRIATAMAYRPNQAARQLKGVKSGMVGVLLDTANRAVMSDRVMAIEQVAAARGVRLLVGGVQGNAARLGEYLADFQNRAVDGMILLFDVTARHDRLLRRLIPRDANAVYHGRPLRPGDKCVRVDTFCGVKLVVEHMLKQGYRRIGLELFNLDDRLMQIRREAYKETLAAAGRKIKPGLIWAGAGSASRPHAEHLDDAIRKLVDHGRIDALIASNDIWAVRFIQRLNEHGWRVPQAVAVSGYDNLDLATVIEPNLTTVDQQHEDYAREALLLLLDGAGNRPERVIEPRLIVRESTRRGPKVSLQSRAGSAGPTSGERV